jgi:hypothetical protein
MSILWDADLLQSDVQDLDRHGNEEADNDATQTAEIALAVKLQGSPKAISCKLSSPAASAGRADRT